jgi:hypothetical protein
MEYHTVLQLFILHGHLTLQSHYSLGQVAIYRSKNDLKCLRQKFFIDNKKATARTVASLMYWLTSNRLAIADRGLLAFGALVEVGRTSS